MRTFQIGAVLLFLGLAGYSYSKDPAGCWKIVDDFGGLYRSVTPFQIEFKPTGPPETQNPAPVAVAATPSPVPAPTPSPTPATPAPSPAPPEPARP